MPSGPRCAQRRPGDEDADAFRAARAESPARSMRRGRGRAREADPLRLPDRRRLRPPRRGRARPLQPRPRRRRACSTAADARRRAGRSRSPRRRLREGFVSPELRLAVYPFRRLVHRRRAAPSPRPGRRGRLAFSDLRVGDYVVHEDHGVARFAGFETREVGGRHPRLPLPRVPAARTASTSPPTSWRSCRRYVGAGGRAGALGARRQALAEHEGARAPRRRRARRGAAQPLRRAAQRARATRSPPTASGRSRFEAAFPYRETAGPDRRDRGGQGRHGVGAADGPPGLRRRRLRQDRGRPAGGRQGGRPTASR